jgi:hypothetical protein
MTENIKKTKIKPRYRRYREVYTARSNLYSISIESTLITKKEEWVFFGIPMNLLWDLTLQDKKKKQKKAILFRLFIIKILQHW